MLLPRLVLTLAAAISASAAMPIGFMKTDVEDRPAPPSEEDVPIAFLVDLGSGQVLLERNADRRFVPASITKVMTTYTAFELLKSGDLKRDQVFTVRPDTFREWNRRGSTMFLPHDARVSVDQLIHGVTTVSANDGSVVLAEGATGSVEAWTALMNRNARAIGMINSHFANPNGWMDEGKTFVTARDLTKLAGALVNRHPEFYRHFVGRPEYRYNNITQPNHDPLIGRVRGADGIKTGFTYESGFGFLGSAERGGRRLAVVVAGADRGSTRGQAARDLIEWGFEAFGSRYLFDAGQTVAEARVQNGDQMRVGLVSNAPIRVSIPEGKSVVLKMQVEYNGPLRAPIQAGETIASLVITGEGMPDARIPLQAEDDVEIAGPIDRILNGIAGWIS